jgi:4-amino-4-deoxy-L-arabinose transferase-like glycosyltransferase
MRAVPVSLLVALIVIAAAWRVASTHRLFSPTWDEPAHIFAGYEYVAQGRYAFDLSHPPLARIAFGFPLRNATSDAHDVNDRIGEILSSAGDYMSGVAAARRGNLLFLAIALIGVAAWAGGLYGTRVAVIAAALFSLLPPILAHAGLATTDMAVAAAIAAGGAVLHRWLAATTWPNTAALAIVFGTGLVTKFSFPFYFGIVALTLMIAARRWPVRNGIAAVVGGFSIVWIVYFFNQLKRFVRGFLIVMKHNAEGHDAYFMGEVHNTGWWEYFPVVLGVKTPMPFLLLAAIGMYFVIRERRNRGLPVMAALMLALVMTSRINLGVRHILPIYLPLSIVAAVAVDRLWRTRARWLAPALGLWLCANSIAAHPDYLPWTNALAGEHPERVVLDSNFDWGQDAVRLRDACRALHIPRLGVGLFGTADLARVGLPLTHPVPREPGGPGWYAVSESFIIPEQVRDPAAFRWLTDGRGFRRVGKTIRLYHVR